MLFQLACATGAPRGSLLVGYRYNSLTPPLPPPEYVTLAPSSDFVPVQVSETEFREAFTRLILEVPLKVATRPAGPLGGRLVLASWPSGGEGDESVEGGYARLCEQRGSPGDCFWLLGEGPGDTLLSKGDRFALALSLALTPAVEGAAGVLRGFSEQAMTALFTGLSIYLVVLMAPEPTTKAVAATLTVLLMSWLGLQTMYELVDGWARLADAAHHATTFKELKAAGEEFGKVLGEDAARAMILGMEAVEVAFAQESGREEMEARQALAQRARSHRRSPEEGRILAGAPA